MPAHKLIKPTHSFLYLAPGSSLPNNCIPYPESQFRIQIVSTNAYCTFTCCILQVSLASARFSVGGRSPSYLEEVSIDLEVLLLEVRLALPDGVGSSSLVLLLCSSDSAGSSLEGT